MNVTMRVRYFGGKNEKTVDNAKGQKMDESVPRFGLRFIPLIGKLIKIEEGYFGVDAGLDLLRKRQ